jgi:hypothetical protein
MHRVKMGIFSSHVNLQKNSCQSFSPNLTALEILQNALQFLLAMTAFTLQF